MMLRTTGAEHHMGSPEYPSEQFMAAETVTVPLEDEEGEAMKDDASIVDTKRKPTSPHIVGVEKADTAPHHAEVAPVNLPVVGQRRLKRRL